MLNEVTNTFLIAHIGKEKGEVHSAVKQCETGTSGEVNVGFSEKVMFKLRARTNRC